MKKKFLLFTLTAGMGYVMLTSNAAGPAAGSGGNRTGAKASTANCSGAGCHGTTITSTARIWIDSAGVPVTQYTAGKVYNVRVVGKHTLNRKFGFQFATVSGAGAAQVQAGTFGSIPTGTASHSLSSLNIIEQTATIAATGTADSFVKAFTWTAPATGVGDIKMYLTINAVDGDGNASAGDGATNLVLNLPLYTPPISSSVSNVGNTAAIKAFPNPVAGDLNIQVGNAYSNYSLQVFDITGRIVLNSQVEANVIGTTRINTSNWIPGVYQVVVSNENSREVIQVVKQ